MLCLTCDTGWADASGTCAACRARWEAAKRSPAFLPTVELFPLDEVVKPIPPKVGKPFDLFGGA